MAIESYSHDAHGNMTSMPHLPVMVWDFRDQLAASQQQAVNGGTGERTYYVYDGAGQRVRKVTERSNGTRRKERVYAGGFEIYREYDSAGTTVTLERETLHVLDSQRRVALVETRTVGSDGSPAQLVRYQLGNHLGSASLELDDAGQVISYEEYHPYGTTSFQSVRSQTETPKRYRYTGKERDEETGLAYHGARYYAPWLGRWTTCDPSSISDGSNLYAYLQCSPCMWIDPSGTHGEPPQLHLIQQTGLRQPVTATATTPGISQDLRATYQDLGAQWMWESTDVGHPENMSYATTPAGKTSSVYPQESSENRSLGSTAEKQNVAAARAAGKFARKDGVDLTAKKGTRYGQPARLEALKDVRTPAPRPPKQLELPLEPRAKPSAMPEQLALDLGPPAKASTSRPVVPEPTPAKPEVSGAAKAPLLGQGINVAFAAAQVIDAAVMARDMTIAEKSRGRSGPAILADEHGTYIVQVRDGLLINDYNKVYLTGSLKGTAVELSFWQYLGEIGKRDAKYGYFDLLGDFVPGQVQPIVIDPYMI